MAAPDANSMSQEGSRHRSLSRVKDSKHDSNHRSRRRKHFPLSTMPHSHRGKRKLRLDLECEWDHIDSTPCIDGVSDDCSSLESNLSILSNLSNNYNIPDKNQAPLPNIRQLCEDFSFSLDSLNDNLNHQSSGPSPPIVTTLHCPFAPSSHETIPSVNIHERILDNIQGPVSRVNLSDYESEADDEEEEENHNYEEEVPLIVDSDCTDEDSLQEFDGCLKSCGSDFAQQPCSSSSDIPFQQVNSISTISTSNSLDSIPTTSSNESLKTVSTTSTSSLSSGLFPCPENYEMLYKNFEIAARMEENKSALRNKSKDQNCSLSSMYNSDASSESSSYTTKCEDSLGENVDPYSRQNWSISTRNSVTTFAKLADSRKKSPAEGREVSADLLGKPSVTHWTEVLSKQCHSSKTSPESGINSPVDQSPESPRVKRPHFLALPLRHIQRPASKPIAISAEEPTEGGSLVPGLFRTFSAPAGHLEYPAHGDQAIGPEPTATRPSMLVGLDKLNSSTVSEIDDLPPQECDDLISWTQAIKQPPIRPLSIDSHHSLKHSPLTDQPPCRSLSTDSHHSLKQAPLIDWEDIFTSRQSFCELESPEKRPSFHSLTSNDCTDINANFSTLTNPVGDGHSPLTMTPKLLEDKAIMTSPYRFRNCNCARVSRASLERTVHNKNRDKASHQQQRQKEASNPSKPSLSALPLQSVDYFSDSDSLSSLESLEMDDCVFRESLYSLTSEHLYQSQTFNQLADEVYEDSLCENTPSPPRRARVTPTHAPSDAEEQEDDDDEVQELYGPRSVLPTCLTEDMKPSSMRLSSTKLSGMDTRKENIPGVVGIPLRAGTGKEPSSMESDDRRAATLENWNNEGMVKRLEDLYQLNFMSRENTPKRVIKHKPLKPIHQVDAEYRCRKVLEQLTKPSHSQSAPSILSNARPQTLFVATQPMVPLANQRDVESEEQEDILDSLPPQEMAVSPKADRKCQELDMFDQKRDLVLAVKSAVEQIVQYYHGSTDTAEKLNPACSPLKGDIHEVVLGQLCPALEGLVRDGMKPFSNSWMVGRVKNTPWIIVQATTQLGPGTRDLHELHNTILRSGLPASSSRKFNAFIMGLLNDDLMCNWVEHCRDHPNIIGKYYEPSAFFTLCNTEPYSQLLHELLTMLGHLSRLRFQLDFLYNTPAIKLLAGKTEKDSLNLQERLSSVKATTSESPRRSAKKGQDKSGESWSSYMDSKKLTSSMWNFVGKVKSYAAQRSRTIQGPADKVDVGPLEADEKDAPTMSPSRGECDGEPSEGSGGIGLEERIAKDTSPERRWSASWIQGFADTIPKSEQGKGGVDESFLPAPKTWSEVFKAAKWQRFGSGWGQMMPKLKWKADSPDGPAGTPVPPLYERQVTGCGTPMTAAADVMAEVTQDKGSYSNVRTRVKTRCHYVSLNPGELSFMKGDILTVRGQPSNEWLHCSLGTEAGLVHVDYIQELD